MEASDNVGSQWGAKSELYNKTIQHVTLLAARTLVEETSMLLPLSKTSTYVLDNGCGPGSVTTSLREKYPTVPITATDISPEMLQILKEKDYTNVQLELADACNLGLPNETFSHALSTFMIQFTPDADQAIREMHRVLRSDGVLGLGTWKSHEFTKIAEEASRRLDPSVRMPLLFGPQWPMDETEIKTRLKKLGFKDVGVQVLQMLHQLSNEELMDYTFSGGNPPAVAYLKPWTENGRIDEFRRECEKIIAEGEWNDRQLRVEAFAAVARKA